MIRRGVAWLVLTIIFIIAGGGINLIRIGAINQMAGVPDQWWRFVLGTVMTVLGTTYLGGFIYYRDQKRGRLKHPSLTTKPPRS